MRYIATLRACKKTIGSFFSIVSSIVIGIVFVLAPIALTIFLVWTVINNQERLSLGLPLVLLVLILIILFGLGSIFPNRFGKSLREFVKITLNIRSIFIFGALGIILMTGLIAIIGTSQQLMHWLKFGEWIERDFYWFLSNIRCAETRWKAKGFEGMDVCRISYVEWSDWVGINQIINQFLDLHIMVFVGLICGICYMIIDREE